MVAWSGGRGKAKRPSGILAGRAGLTRVRGPGWGSPGIHGFGHTHGVQTMSMSSRVAGVLFGVALVAAGCDKSSTTGPKPADDTYAKKLVGGWEGTEEGPKGDKPETVTVEFKADHGLKIAMGPFELEGTWKTIKEEGKTVTVETEVTLAGMPELKDKPKADKKSFNIVFEDANNIVMSKVGDQPDPKKLKRKS